MPLHFQRYANGLVLPLYGAIPLSPFRPLSWNLVHGGYFITPQTMNVRSGATLLGVTQTVYHTITRLSIAVPLAFPNDGRALLPLSRLARRAHAIPLSFTLHPTLPT